MGAHAGGIFFFFQAEDGIRDKLVTGVQTCALPISSELAFLGPLCAEAAVGSGDGRVRGAGERRGGDPGALSRRLQGPGGGCEGSSDMAELDCAGRTVREINARIRELGEADIVGKNPGARHNLGVAILKPARIRFEGSVGYYCGGLVDGAEVEDLGRAGLGPGES